jgi:hypothetical protein
MSLFIFGAEAKSTHLVVIFWRKNENPENDPLGVDL